MEPASENRRWCRCDSAVTFASEPWACVHYINKDGCWKQYPKTNNAAQLRYACYILLFTGFCVFCHCFLPFEYVVWIVDCAFETSVHGLHYVTIGSHNTLYISYVIYRVIASTFVVYIVWSRVKNTFDSWILDSHWELWDPQFHVDCVNVTR